jgi:hypothetical protein
MIRYMGCGIYEGLEGLACLALGEGCSGYEKLWF